MKQEANCNSTLRHSQMVSHWCDRAVTTAIKTGAARTTAACSKFKPSLGKATLLLGLGFMATHHLQLLSEAVPGVLPAIVLPAIVMPVARAQEDTGKDEKTDLSEKSKKLTEAIGDARVNAEVLSKVTKNDKDGKLQEVRYYIRLTGQVRPAPKDAPKPGGPPEGKLAIAELTAKKAVKIFCPVGTMEYQPNAEPAPEPPNVVYALCGKTKIQILNWIDESPKAPSFDEATNKKRTTDLKSAVEKALDDPRLKVTVTPTKLPGASMTYQQVRMAGQLRSTDERQVSETVACLACGGVPTPPEQNQKVHCDFSKADKQDIIFLGYDDLINSTAPTRAEAQKNEKAK